MRTLLISILLVICGGTALAQVNNSTLTKSGTEITAGTESTVKSGSPAKTLEKPTQLSPPLQISQRMNDLQAARDFKQNELEAAQNKATAIQAEMVSLQLASEIARRDALDAYDVPKEERAQWVWKLIDKVGWVLVKTPPKEETPKK